MINSPKVGITNPNYHDCDFILRTLSSVFARTALDYEIVVMKDGSPDDARIVLAPLIEIGRIQYFEQKTKAKVAPATAALNVRMENVSPLGWSQPVRETQDPHQRHREFFGHCQDALGKISWREPQHAMTSP